MSRSPHVVLISLAVTGSVTCGGPPSPSTPVTALPTQSASAAPPSAFSYPPTMTVAVADDYHGTKVPDPYRWLEDLDADETRSWVEAQNALTFDYLGRIHERDAIRRRLTQLWDYERYGIPHKEGARYFVSKNDGLQNQSVLYWTDAPAGQLRPLLDPNQLSPDGTVALSGIAIDDRGRTMAYGLSSSGSDWQEWRVRDVTTGKDRNDLLQWIKFSGASWSRDGKGFYYSRYDEPRADGAKFEDVNYFQKLFFHRIGDEQANDRLIYERKDKKEWGFDGTVSEDGKWLIIAVRIGTDPKNGLFYRDLRKPGTEIIELLDRFDGKYVFVGNDGPVFWIRTDRDAPRGRLIAIDTRKPAPELWREIVPETAETLQSVHVVGDRFIATYLKDARSQVKVFTLDGKFEREVELPGIGTVAGFDGKRTDKEAFYSFTSFTTPGTIYRYDVKSGTSEVWKEPSVGFDPTNYVTEQVFYPSKDGTRVPMFVTMKKGTPKDGKRPVYLYGYGGFNISLTPTFSVPNLVWLEMGGILAIPNLRGGGEYGESWHKAGTKHDKQNVFDDFIAAAEWLIQNGWTNREKLAIGGRSNGGLLVGAAMTQRPDLFAAALPGVGVMDMLRFHKFTIGWAWVSDYGSPDDPQDFAALHAYSPYHNIKDGVQYPATMVHTADHDDRVVPGHSYKFAARLQKAHRGDRPVMIRVDVKAGHGAGKPTTKIIEEWTDLWGFLVANLAMTVEL